MQLINFLYKKCFLLLLISFISNYTLNAQVHASTANFNYSLKFSEDDSLTLTAGNVPLGVLLEDIQQGTDLKLKIHKDHVQRPVSVNFESLPLEQAIKRIMKGINYICLFDSDKKVTKIITISNPIRKVNNSEANRSHIIPVNTSRNNMPPPMIEDMEIAMGIDLSHGIEEQETAMEIMVPSPTEKMNMAMEIIPPPQNLNIDRVMKIEPLPE